MTSDDRAAAYIVCSRRKNRARVNVLICAACPRFHRCPDVAACYIRAGFPAAQTRQRPPARTRKPTNKRERLQKGRLPGL